MFLISALPVCALASDEMRFNRDVRPILSANCYPCHGPDANNRQADLRLDTAAGIEYAFADGSLDDSEAWQRITSDDDEYRMPPPDSHHEVKAEEIARLRTWIEQGAKWEGHWSFITPTHPTVPHLTDASRIINPIDAFIQARLVAQGLRPASMAERQRLLRRVTFDLIGLPPTLDEIDTFMADDSDEAYETVVNHLLSSPHFGERMAVAWMDAARYGDTSVFHADGPRDMWPWRDWVIDAYNANKSFDKFTVEQLAGDLLPNATNAQRVASGFNRNNATTDEGGAIAEEYRVEYAVDRVKTTSLVWLGLTMECAQCHDHKYDPISQREYYQFFAYFNQASDPGMQTRNGNQTPMISVTDGARTARAKRLTARLPEFQKRVSDRAAASAADFDAWFDGVTSNGLAQPVPPDDMVLHVPLDENAGEQVANLANANTYGKVHGKPLWDSGRFAGSLRLDGNNFVDLGDSGDYDRDQAFSYGAWINPNEKSTGAAIARMDERGGHRGYDLLLQKDGRLEVHLVNKWPNNAIKVKTKNNAVVGDRWQHAFVTYDGGSKAAGVRIYVDGKTQELQVERDELSETIRTEKPLYIGRRNPGFPFHGLIDDVRIYPRELSADEVAALAGDIPIRPLLTVAPADRTEDQLLRLREYYLQNVDDAYKSARQDLKNHEEQIANLEKPIGNVMVMQDVPRMRPTYVLDRGNYDSPRKDAAVQPGTLSALPPLPTAASNRLGMAQWLMQPDHPLTARVVVNRYWYMLFGTGIVKTVEDFGSQGEWPSHPELLDWLAVDFRESGWDIKRMIKQMVMSWAYRQSAAVGPELLERDPANRLLARGPRFRLQAEFIRDNALSASGLLVPRIGGPGVKPYQPAGLWNEVSLNTDLRFSQDHGDRLYRRGMYVYWKRSAPAPSLAIFDTPTRDKCVLRRARTNTPLQALVTLNDTQYVEAARALAERAWCNGGDSLRERVIHAYRLATGVQPDEATVELLQKTFADERDVFATYEERAKALLGVGELARDEQIDIADHAAMTIVASIILNLDETLTRG